ncbi:hypothetical protein QNI19_10360 [Cytophagaceae bacterium DM2B3-1]|uniref:Uncharacterized protein n=1 Tax=Xanthocytophaga flava TaxID=3048013 RepID=A0ABT7CHW9_9BACT|nr:hypothetical protein [Xanthocytophaga flavus]MDJ1493333.1 hypothetical protein [Xanthocytophaga flavus]
MNKKTFILLAIMTLGIISQVHSQILEENKVDDSTHTKIQRTSWETLNMTLRFNSYFRISRINEQTYLDLKMMIGSAFSIKEQDEIIFKLSNGEFIKLLNLKDAKTCIGCGARGFNGSIAPGIEVSYILEKEQLEKLKNNTAVKITVYTNRGYVEEKVKEKNGKKISMALKLIE